MCDILKQQLKKKIKQTDDINEQHEALEILSCLQGLMDFLNK